jgi:hypothetical protein
MDVIPAAFTALNAYSTKTIQTTSKPQSNETKAISGVNVEMPWIQNERTARKKMSN